MLFLPRLPALWARCQGPLPTCCGRGCAGVGAQHCPLGLHALWGLRAVGVVEGRPQGGWPATVARGVWCQALFLPWPPVLWGGQPGFCDPHVPGAVGANVGTRHRPDSVRPCGPALRTVGIVGGRPWGVAFRRCQGRLRSGAPPPSLTRPLGGLSGSTTHVLWARVCRCRGPALSPSLARPVGAACRGGGGGPPPGGAARHRCDGCLMSGAVPSPANRPLGRAAGVPRPVCLGCGWCRRGEPAPAPQRAPFRAGVATLWGWRRDVPGGGAFGRCEGRLRSGAPPPPTARPPGGLSGSATHVLWARTCGCGGPARAVGSRALMGAAHRGGGGGRLGSGAPPSPAARPLGGLPAPAGHVLWAQPWVRALCVVSVRCMPWCVVLPFVCPSDAPLSGALFQCCARRVLAVPPLLRACLARLLATSCFFRGFVALYPFLYSPLARPPPTRALSPCLCPGVCLGLSPCLLLWSRFPGPLLSLLLGPVRQWKDGGGVGLRAAAQYGYNVTYLRLSLLTHVRAIIGAFFVARRVKYLCLHSCLRVCARSLPFLSYQRDPVRGGGGRVALAVTCSCGQACLLCSHASSRVDGL